MQKLPVFTATDVAIFLFPGKKIRPSFTGHSHKALFYGVFTLAPNGYLVSITLLLSHNLLTIAHSSNPRGYWFFRLVGAFSSVLVLRIWHIFSGCFSVFLCASKIMHTLCYIVLKWTLFSLLPYRKWYNLTHTRKCTQAVAFVDYWVHLSEWCTDELWNLL